MICITGGLGYIGSHICVSLLQQGYNVICIDNLSNTTEKVLDNIFDITKKKPKFYNIDLCNLEKMSIFFNNYINKINCVIHCASLKSVEDSNNNPLHYYENNVIGTINLIKCMENTKCYNLIFSSSATVYGNPEYIPITENCKTNTLNPYGRTKLMIEEILQDISKSNKYWKIIILRYFNPVGAHSSYKIGENPKNKPTNLFPYIMRVIKGEEEYINIYGIDYNTPDGTCIRDYIHISDLVNGHIIALKNISKFNDVEIINLGTGKGYSVLEIISEMETIINKKIPYKIDKRRKGDTAICYASIDKSYNLLNWKATKTINEMCLDTFKWYSKLDI